MPPYEPRLAASEALQAGAGDPLDFIRNLLTYNANPLAGSVMDRPEKPQWRKDSPLLDTIMGALDTLVSGISPLDAASGGMGTQLAHIPGTYRSLGLARQGGVLSPIDFAAKLMEQPNFARFKQLVESAVRKGHGNEFEAFRGFSLNDPLAKAVLSGELPPATAVSLKPEVAQTFMKEAGFQNVPGVIASMTATPESVLSLLPKRGSAYGGEAELLLDPRRISNFNITQSQAAQPTTDLLQAAIRDALQRSGPLPIPGSGAAALSSGAPPPGILEKLKNIPGQPQQPLSVTGVSSAIEAAKQEVPSNQSMLAYITKALFDGP